MGSQRDRRVDEGPARNVYRGDQRREREQQAAIEEERAKVEGTASRPPSDHHERRQREAGDQRGEDHHGGHEPTDPRGQERPDAHAQQVVQRGRGRDAVPLADVPDEEDAP
jgi:hypothetical protein